jgi:hypothetical protein
MTCSDAETGPYGARLYRLAELLRETIAADRFPIFPRAAYKPAS